jgi:hypothetical protein
MDHFFYLDLRNGAHLHQAASTRKHGYLALQKPVKALPQPNLFAMDLKHSASWAFRLWVYGLLCLFSFGFWP